jgi:hypothetical protein
LVYFARDGTERYFVVPVEDVYKIMFKAVEEWFKKPKVTE